MTRPPRRGLGPITINHVWVVIPAFNEARQGTIGQTVRNVRAVFAKVVDDCSADATQTLAHEAGAHVCRHPVNLGQGAALATGIEYALQHGAEAIITFDADGQHAVSDARALVDRLARGDVDVVLGSRFLGETPGMPRSRRMVLRAATIFTRLTTGLKVTDTHNGLRAFNRHAATAIEIRHNKMAHASEILSQIARLKLRYAEAPNTVTYTTYSMEKGQRLRGAVRIMLDLIAGALSK